ncbi:MAG TPA: hypothetical protein DD738_15610 [Ruminiclostridium sp.]|nr:hypothetical protein [Ruminiclostridium sp.]
MNIGMIVPSRTGAASGMLLKVYSTVRSFFFHSIFIETHRIGLMEGLNLTICSIPLQNGEELDNMAARRKLKLKLDRIFEEEGAWPVLEHPKLKGLYDPNEFPFEKALAEAASNRFLETIKLVHGIGNLSSREITITGGSIYLENAISKLITKVKAMNILLPEGSRPPDEAEEAFAETGIPVHITNDPEVLNRSALWIRFPLDHHSFDALPERFDGIILDFGNMKIIDTKNKKIFNILLEFSDRIKRRLGHNILKSWEEGVLEGVILTMGAKAWDITCTEASLKLGMRLSFKS